MFRSAIRRILSVPLILAAALFFLVEEYLWSWLTALVGRLARVRLVARLEDRIERLPPYPAMVLFLLPTALLIPVKLAALYAVGTGHLLLGGAVIVGAKLLGTAVVARLFVLCRPALLSLAWFARLYRWVVTTKELLYARVRAMPGWQRLAAAASLARHGLARLTARAADLVRRIARALRRYPAA